MHCRKQNFNLITKEMVKAVGESSQWTQEARDFPVLVRKRRRVCVNKTLKLERKQLLFQVKESFHS